MKKGLLVCASALIGLTLVGCGNSSEISSTASSAASSTASSTASSVAKSYTTVGEYYTVMNTNCVEKVTVTVKDKKVVSAHFSETPYFFTAASAVSENDSIEKVSYETTKGYGSSATTVTAYAAKYFSLGGKVFTGTALTTKTNGENVKYTATGIDDLMAYAKASSDNAKWIYDSLKSNSFYLCSDANGTESTIANSWKTTYGSYFKDESTCSYWSGSNYEASYGKEGGWKYNVGKIEAAMVGLDLTTAPTLTKNDSNQYLAGTVNTGATITSAQQFFDAASVAFNKAIASTADKVGETYTVMNTNCVEKITVTVGSNGKVTSAHFSETPYFFTAAAAVSENDSIEKVSYETTKGYGSSATTVTAYAAKYFSLGGKVFTGTALTTKTNGENVKYTATGIDDLMAYAKASSDNAKWIYDSLKSNSFYLCSDANGTESTIANSWKTTYGSYFKDESTCSYWSGSNYEASYGKEGGWKYNVGKIEAAMVGLDLTTAPTLTKNDSNQYLAGTVNTGATITSAQQFFDAASVAFNKAIA